ncbi:MAG: hypothetical protein IT427_01765 [Pirellulales bacterium]|nr:hypothetical protein [Pirellulales bacterium]
MPSNDRPLQPPHSPLPERPRSSLWATFVAIAFGLAMFLGLVALAGALGPIVIAIGGSLLVLIAIAVGHYFLWGYWLGDSIRREVEEEEAKKRDEE